MKDELILGPEEPAEVDGDGTDVVDVDELPDQTVRARSS